MNKDIINSRTGVGAGLGALAGFIVAGPPGAAMGALLGGGVAHASSGHPSKGVLTPRRKLIFARAMEGIKDPTELQKLADAFAGEGLPTEAAMLRKRAALRDLPADAQEKRRAAFRKAMASDKPDAILVVAKAFEEAGSVDAAKALRDHAEGVRAAHAAGKTSRPMAGGSQAQFAEKLAKAIIHFGPESAQAKAAGRNLCQARGKAPTDALVAEVVKVAADALKVEAPVAEEPADGAASAVEIDATEAGQAGEGVSESPGGPAQAPVASTAAIDPTTAEPTAVPLEGQVVADGAPPPAMVATAPAEVEGQAHEEAPELAVEEPSVEVGADAPDLSQEAEV